MGQAPAGVWVLIDGQWLRHGGQPVNPPPPPPPTGMRFAGDTQPLTTGQLYMGASVKGGGSPGPWETAAGVKMGNRHRYWNNTTDISTPNGPIIAAIKEDHAAGRLPIVSWHLPGAQWAAAAGGSLDSELAAFFGVVDELAKPSYVIVNHEPENGDGTAANYKAWMLHFRARLDAYRAGHPSGRKNMVFLGCLMAATASGSNGGLSVWWPGDGVFDVLGIDGYAWDNGYTMPSAAMKQMFTFCAAHDQPFGISEYGVRPTDPNGGTKIRNLYTLMTSKAYDCLFLSYFQVDGNSWTLTSGNGTYQAFISELKDPHSVHMFDLGY